MTVAYLRNFASCEGFGCFWKLLLRWKGSVYKLIWTEMLLYSVLYFTISLIYRFALTNDQRRVFEKISLQTDDYTSMIPVAFLLGFYVTIVVQRWWDQLQHFTWIDPISLLISSYITGNDPKSRYMRRTMMRYVNLSCVMMFGLKSPTVHKRYPTLSHYVHAGLLTQDEHEIMSFLDGINKHSKYSVPLIWAGMLASKARREGRIPNDIALNAIIEQLVVLRNKCGSLLDYDWVNIPLVYTQVITIAVYSFFLATLMGRQFLDPSQHYEKNGADFVIPIFTYLQLVFYMGWLKVAETLVHPFGEDDDDFEVNWFIDRCEQMSYLLVDDVHTNIPSMVSDVYWDELFSLQFSRSATNQELRKWSISSITVLGDDQKTSLINDDQISKCKKVSNNVEDASSCSQHQDLPKGFWLGAWWDGLRPSWTTWPVSNHHPIISRIKGRLSSSLDSFSFLTG